MKQIITLALELGSMNADELFFYENAGASMMPTETWAEGRLRGARDSVLAERWARREGWRFSWQQCDTTSQEFSSKRPYYPLQSCAMVDPKGRTEWRYALHGIDFGRDNPAPHGSYVRVVEAELARECMAEAPV